MQKFYFAKHGRMELSLEIIYALLYQLDKNHNYNVFNNDLLIHITII